MFFLQFFLQKKDLCASASPLFFGSWFEPPQSTTPESHISDYRSQKRANSEIDLNASLSSNVTAPLSDEDDNSEISNRQEQNINKQENFQKNVEFYADVVGKFLGTVRSSITNFVDAIRMNREREQMQLQQQKDMKNEKLQIEESKPRLISHIQSIIRTKTTKQSENHENEMENSIRMRTIDTLSSTTPSKTAEIQFDSMEQNKSNFRFHNESKTNHNLNGKIDEIEDKVKINFDNDDGVGSNSKVNTENRKRSLKQKRSDKTFQSNLNGGIEGRADRRIDDFQLQSISDEGDFLRYLGKMELVLLRDLLIE